MNIRTLFCLLAILAAFPAEGIAEVRHDRAAALAEIDRQGSDQVAERLLRLARTGDSENLWLALQRYVADETQAGAQREYTLWRLARSLGDFEPGRVEPRIVDYLAGYRSEVLVSHHDHPDVGVPLFDVAMAAQGSRNRWSRESAYRRSTDLLAGDPDRWITAYQQADTAAQRGFRDGLQTANDVDAARLVWQLSSGPLNDESLALAAAQLAIRPEFDALARRLLSQGPAAAAPPLIRMLAQQESSTRLETLLRWIVDHAPEDTAALALALWAPVLVNDDQSLQWFTELAHGSHGKPGLAATAALALPDERRQAPDADSVLNEGRQSGHARIVEWVEDAPSSDDSVIALGYPVPVPVATTLPFAGFRTYAGLHLRHQQLATGTPWVHASLVGETRQDRGIWAYQLGDANRATRFGQPEHAMLTNGGIHAREWQSPEVATGIIEYIAEAGGDPLVDYLRDNANILVIPVLNIDGFLQTQRYPDRNWLGTDISDPDNAPRDGRMRRKNMRSVDDQLETRGDHLLGVDLNRNNSPYWATSTRSSGDPDSLVHHGTTAGSEPETRALDAAAQLGPIGKLSMYTDMHSFSQVHFWARNGNHRLTAQTQQLLGLFSQFHAAFPEGKWYDYSNSDNVALNRGIGSTDEYFTHIYQVPSWTLEIEPRGGFGQHGNDYGGLGRNVHDGFILPAAEVPRVRTELARTFAVAYYRQAGPPSLSEFRIFDDATGALVFEAAWDPEPGHRRQLRSYQPAPLAPDRDYTVWMAWDKPMRWRHEGELAPLPGTLNSLGLDISLVSEDGDIDLLRSEAQWLADAGPAPAGYARYRDDSVAFSLRIPSSDGNLEILDGGVELRAGVRTRDLVGLQTDPMPETVAHWKDGGWAGYENDAGKDGLDTGGTDFSIAFEAAAGLSSQADPFVAEAGLSSAWFDPERNGEGFILEVISPAQAVMYWFTYDDEGRQNWYTATGDVRGNQVHFDQLIGVSGGRFGPEFDPNEVRRHVVGRATFTWTSCQAGRMAWVFDRGEQAWRSGRMNLVRLTGVLGAGCGQDLQPLPGAALSGSWYDPEHDGEGYTLQMLDNGQALVYWFSYDGSGNPRWFFGVGDVAGDVLTFDDLYTTRGARFGQAFDPVDLVLERWGALEFQLACRSGTARFESVEPGFPAGSLALTQLTSIDGLSCSP